jgi:hypothetical protein
MTESMGTPPVGSGPTTGPTTGTTGTAGITGTTGTSGLGTGLGTPSGTGSSGSGSGGDDSTRDVAKDEARGVAQDAAERGKATAQTAKEQAGQVAGEATSQARQLIDQARSELTSQGSAQKEKATGGLRSLADELSGLLEGNGAQSGAVAGIAQEASDRVRSAADWLETHETGDVLQEVRRFARQRPGMFLLGAAAVGFLGGRLTRGFADEVKEYGEAEERQSGGTGGTVGTSRPSGVVGGTASGPVGTGYLQTGPGASYGGSDLPDEPTGTPGYAVPPTAQGDRGDSTAQFAPNVGVGGDQMPSEFGARGTGAQGNRPEEGTR